MLRTWCRLSKTNATTPGQALYCRHVASTEALAVPRAPGQMRAFRWRSFNPRHAANFGYFAPVWRNVPPRFLQQSDVCFCFRSELLLLRDRLQLWTEFWPVSDRCRLTADQFRHLMLLSVEGPHIPDIRDAREQQNAVFEQLVNETYLCWQKKPRRWIQRKFLLMLLS